MRLFTYRHFHDKQKGRHAMTMPRHTEMHATNTAASHFIAF